MLPDAFWHSLVVFVPDIHFKRNKRLLLEQLDQDLSADDDLSDAIHDRYLEMVQMERADPARVRYAMDAETGTRLIALVPPSRTSSDQSSELKASAEHRLVMDLGAWEAEPNKATEAQQTLHDFYTLDRIASTTAADVADDWDSNADQDDDETFRQAWRRMRKRQQTNSRLARCEQGLYHEREKRIQDLDGYESDLDYEFELDQHKLRDFETEGPRQSREIERLVETMQRPFEEQLRMARLCDDREHKAARAAIAAGEARALEEEQYAKDAHAGNLSIPPPPGPISHFDAFMNDAEIARASSADPDELDRLRELASDGSWTRRLCRLAGMARDFSYGLSGVSLQQEAIAKIRAHQVSLECSRTRAQWVEFIHDKTLRAWNKIKERCLTTREYQARRFQMRQLEKQAQLEQQRPWRQRQSQVHPTPRPRQQPQPPWQSFVDSKGDFKRSSNAGVGFQGMSLGGGGNGGGSTSVSARRSRLRASAAVFVPASVSMILHQEPCASE